MSLSVKQAQQKGWSHNWALRPSAMEGQYPCGLPHPTHTLERPPILTTHIGPRTGPCDRIHPLLRCRVVFCPPCDCSAQTLRLGLRRRLRVRQGVGGGALLACGLCGRRHGRRHRSVLVSGASLQTRAEADRSRSCLSVHRVCALWAVPSGCGGCGASSVGTGRGRAIKAPCRLRGCAPIAGGNSTLPCDSALWLHRAECGRAGPVRGGWGVRPGRCV